MASLKNTIINDTGYLKLPNGTTAQRPGSPVAGYMRWNTTLSVGEYWSGSEWLTIPYVPGCTANTLNILGDGSCVAAYTLDGNANDLSNNYNGSPTSITYGTGEFGQAALFNGSTSAISIPYTSGGNISITGWFKFNTTTVERPIFCLDNLGNGTRALQIKISPNDNRLYIYWFTGSDMFTTTTLSANVWYNFAATFEQNVAAKIYINGQFDKQVTNVGVRPVQPNFFMGKYGIGNINANLNGSIDQVRIFNKSLSASEVLTVFEETACT